MLKRPEVIKTGGRWDPDEWPVYFAASNPSVFTESVDTQQHILLAINELEGNQWRDVFKRCANAKKDLFIDSGVYGLSTAHAKAHDISMDRALSMAPDKIDG